MPRLAPRPISAAIFESAAKRTPLVAIVDLTAREWAVFERLIRHANIVVSKDQIEDSLYAFGAEIESNAVEVLIHSIRKKFGKEIIRNVRGAGWLVDR